MRTMLIVEDNEFNIDLLMHILEEDYALLVARDGAESVRMAADCAPDVVLMDMSLPVLDGYQATGRIRETCPGMPVIGLSSHAMQGDAEQALAVGCCNYMTKPVDEDLLLGCLRTLFE